MHQMYSWQSFWDTLQLCQMDQNKRSILQHVKYFDMRWTHCVQSQQERWILRKRFRHEKTRKQVTAISNICLLDCSFQFYMRYKFWLDELLRKKKTDHNAREL